MFHRFTVKMLEFELFEKYSVNNNGHMNQAVLVVLQYSAPGEWF